MKNWREDGRIRATLEGRNGKGVSSQTFTETVSGSEIPAELTSATPLELECDQDSADIRGYTPGQLEALLLKSEARECTDSLYRFVCHAWHTIYPTRPFVGGWHIEAICEHLQALTERQIRNLIINVPRRHSKSSVVSVMWPAWVWCRLASKFPIGNTSEQFMFASYAHALSIRDSVRCRRVIESAWYQRMFPHVVLSHQQNTKIRFDNTSAGYRFSTSVGGTVLGDGGDVLVMDDPNNLMKIHSERERDMVIQWYKEVFLSGLNDPLTGIKLLIQQRGHAMDVTGYLLLQEADEWEHLFMPAEYKPKYHCVTKIWEDPRREEGELLWPQRFSKSYIDKLRRTLGSYAAAAQIDQNPVPAEGGVFKFDWFKYYTPAQLPPQHTWTDSCISIDMSFGSTKATASFTVAEAWARVGPDFYLVDQIRGQWEYVEAKRRIKAFIAKWKAIFVILVEDKANGPAILSDFSQDIPGMFPVTPDGSKEARARSVSPLVESGNVYIPDPEHRDSPRWIHDYITEVCSFPKAPTDDQVDSTSQALHKLRSDLAFGCVVEDDEDTGGGDDSFGGMRGSVWGGRMGSRFGGRTGYADDDD